MQVLFQLKNEEKHAVTSEKLNYILPKHPSYPDSEMISGATYVGVPHTVYKGPSTTVARPKSPSFNDLVPSGYSNTWNANR